MIVAATIGGGCSGWILGMKASGWPAAIALGLGGVGFGFIVGFLIFQSCDKAVGLLVRKRWFILPQQNGEKESNLR
jgi:hypothetical protein